MLQASSFLLWLYTISTKEMTEEISLSISETNKLRAQLGLKLIEESEPEPKPVTETKSSNELSIEETNKLRLSLGLKPIPLENTANNVDVEPKQPAADLQQDKIRKRIEEAKLKASKKRKLQSDADSVFSNESESTDTWLDNLGKPKKASAEEQKAKKKIKVAYNTEQDDDLDGAVVDYDADELALLSNNDILTFKDTDVLDDDEIEGELSNTMLEKRRKLKYELKERANAENVKHLGRHHKQIDENSDIEDDNGGSEKVLVRNKVSGNLINVNDRKVPKAILGEEKKLQLVDLFSDIGGEVATGDYAKPKQTKMKKLKKKGSSSNRSKSVEPLDIKVVQLDQEQADDDDVDSELQEVLSRKRKLKQREARKNLTSEEMAQEISIYERLEKERELESIHTVPEGLVFDDVSEFFNKLGDAAESGNETIENGNGNGDKAVEIETVDNGVVAKDNGITQVEEEKIQQEETESNHVSAANEEEGEEAAPKFNGLGSTLKFLQSQNIVQKSTREDQTRARELREAQREAEILKFNISVEERVLRDELAQDKQFMNTSKIEREELFQLYLDQRLREKRILPEVSNAGGKYSRYRQAGTTPTAVNKLKNYNPQVKLTYRDDDGNELSTKQAYKVLSHQFHGVGPSNNKLVKKNGPSDSKNQIIH